MRTRPNSPLMSTDELAAVLGVSRQSVALMIHQDRLPAGITAVRVGRFWKFSRKRVAEALEIEASA